MRHGLCADFGMDGLEPGFGWENPGLAWSLGVGEQPGN